MFQSIEIFEFLKISVILFFVSILGISVIRKNIIVILMSIELMLLSININFIIFSIYLDDLIGQMFSLLILTVAASESAIGLAILVIYYRSRGLIDISFINFLKG